MAKKIFLLFLFFITIFIISYSFFERRLYVKKPSTNNLLIQNDMIIPPNSLTDLKLIIDFGDGKKYEAMPFAVINPEEKNPVGLLKASAYGIKREVGFASYEGNNLIKLDENNRLVSIGDYNNNNFSKWHSFVNGKSIPEPYLYTLKSNDLVEWKYIEY